MPTLEEERKGEGCANGNMNAVLALICDVRVSTEQLFRFLITATRIPGIFNLSGCLLPAHPHSLIVTPTHKMIR